ncbi:MAG: cytoplasmic protein [Promethearchaeota archaeon]
MDKKFALFMFRDGLMCFGHVLLNALEMFSVGYSVKIIIEGEATNVIPVYHANPNALFGNLYKRAKEEGLIDAVCKACATKMHALEAAQAEQLPIVEELNGHPSMKRYLEDGYQIITF